MPTPNSHLLEVIWTTRQVSKEAQNVFYYWDELETNNIALISAANSFDSLVASQMVNIMSDEVESLDITVKDVLGTVPDYSRVPSVGVGAITGETLPGFAAYRFDLFPQTKETRRGYKRFIGVPEVAQDLGVLTPAYETFVQNREGDLLAPLVAGGGNWTPVIYGKATPSDPTRSIVNPVISVTARFDLTTQSSRKF